MVLCLQWVHYGFDFSRSWYGNYQTWHLPVSGSVDQKHQAKKCIAYTDLAKKSEPAPSYVFLVPAEMAWQATMAGADLKFVIHQISTHFSSVCFEYVMGKESMKTY